MTIRLGINFSAEKITQKIHDTTVHPDSVGKDLQCRGYSLWRYHT